MGFADLAIVLAFVGEPAPSSPPTESPIAPTEATPLDAPPVDPPTVEPTPPLAVPDESWAALVDREIIVIFADGTEVRGTLLGHSPDTVTLADQSGAVQTIARVEVLSVAIAPAPEPTPPPPLEEVEPAPSQPVQHPPQPERERDARLGVFVAQGPGVGFWSAKGLTGKTVAYRLDAAVGIDAGDRVMFAVQAGGLLGGRIDDDVRATFGRIGLSVTPHGRYFAGQFGLGAGFSRLVSTHDRTHKFEDLGLAVPSRLMGIVPLPKQIFLGIGISYEFAALAKFRIFYNMIAFELTVGRW